MSMLAAPDTITGPLRAEDLDRATNPGNVWLLPRRASAQCPPCNGHCRQGRDCPGPDTIPTDYSELALLDNCAIEGGRHADPVAAPRFSKSAPYINAILLTAGYLWEERRPFVYVALALVLAVVGYGFRVFLPLA